MELAVVSCTVIVIRIVPTFAAASFGGYSAANMNLNFQTPDMTNVKANLSEGATRLSGKVIITLFCFWGPLFDVFSAYISIG